MMLTSPVEHDSAQPLRPCLPHHVLDVHVMRAACKKATQRLIYQAEMKSCPTRSRIVRIAGGKLVMQISKQGGGRHLPVRPGRISTSGASEGSSCNR